MFSFLPKEHGMNDLRGFGFVTFADQNSAENAIKKLKQTQLDGRTLQVNEARPKVLFTEHKDLNTISDGGWFREVRMQCGGIRQKARDIYPSRGGRKSCSVRGNGGLVRIHLKILEHYIQTRESPC